MRKDLFTFLLAVSISGSVAAQTDTIVLKEISVSFRRENIERLPELKDTYIWAGKKSEVINLQYLDANITEKTPRQIFAKVPGIFVYDMDGSGNQVNISTRGLDPHRGWEFNIRTNGIITNTDMYGYPASHFSLPMEAVGRIELVRGTGALQYGAQFGGMLNYETKRPDTTHAFGLEASMSAGSFGLLSNYVAAGGKTGKLEYYGYYSKRTSDGYRENGKTDYDAQGLILNYRFSPKVSLNASLLRSKYRYQIPGPLTDSMFLVDPRQSTRSRNYYSPEIYVPSLTLRWKLGAMTSLKWTASAILGQRSSVQFNKPADVPDIIDANTLQYAPRQVDIDQYHSYTTEMRLMHAYPLHGRHSHFAVGVQYINNDLHRRQLGVGSTGTDYDLNISEAGWGRDLHFKTGNIAVFAENKFQLTPAWSLSPGFRFESGASDMVGTISYYPLEDVPNTIEHHFALLGLNTEYRLGQHHDLYAGFSQAYRPVIFKDIVPASPFERADKDLEDAFGYNLELGYRGRTGALNWDISAFRLQYNHRLGNLALEEGGEFFILRTNIGNSVTNGVEMFAEYNFDIGPRVHASIFSSTAWMDATYQDASVRAGDENVDISGNKVESTPPWISRNGLNIKYKSLSTSVLYSYTSESFADPLNTVTPSANGAVGLVPSYGILDLNASYRFGKMVVRVSLNNLLDKQYFTKRPTFYPGPGIWSSDGRGFVASVALKL
ncbi:MAG: TonB-dependent receptor [Lewinellaceae bacterium]|nr:TonB-dependent receptor [Saprospiraceae bacterium]MCB9356182.1 TonB-dependent receptor [Lewinellaceae bacterium]